MFSIDVKTTEKNPSYTKQLTTVVKSLTDKKVVAGFPKGELNTPHYEFKSGISKEHNKKAPSIIDVAIWNNFGIGVPRREFMAESARKWQQEWVENFEKIQRAMEKGEIDVDKVLKTMGLSGENIVSTTIRDWQIPPNSRYTIKMKGANNPLVDTGDMMNAPRYEIRKVEK